MASRALAHLPRATLCSLSRAAPTVSKSRLTRLSSTLSSELPTSTTGPTEAADPSTNTIASPNESTATSTSAPARERRVDRIFDKIKRYNEQAASTMTPAEPQKVGNSDTRALMNEARVALEASEQFEEPVPIENPAEALVASAERLANSVADPEAVDLSEAGEVVQENAKVENSLLEENAGEPVNTASPPPLLTTPPRPEGKLTPWISSQEFKDYLQPLYKYGWQVGFQKIIKHEAVSLVLGNRVFSFTNWNQGMEFMNDVNVVAQEENHHPIDMTIAVKNRAAQVTMTLKTHAAKRPVWIKKDETERRMAGVTVRDLRFVTLVEHLYGQKFAGGAPSVLPPRHRQPTFPVIQKLLNIPSRQLGNYCTACGGRHSVEQCGLPSSGDSIAKQFLPLCVKCKQRHAKMSLCPKSRNVKMAKPTTPCPNCGGAHWLIDCRKPQLPEEEAASMMIPLSPELTLEK